MSCLGSGSLRLGHGIHDEENGTDDVELDDGSP
jgi:hypothetical protein